jgi:hypothetical protein
MPIGWMAAAAGGSALIGAWGSQEAAKTQAGAANHAADVQLGMFNRTRSDLQPYMDAGSYSLQDLMYGLGLPSGLKGAQGGTPGSESISQIPGQASVSKGMFTQPFGMEQFEASPAYKFNLEQGMDAINKQAAARGSYYEPATLRDVARFSQGLASNEFQNAFSNYNTNLGNIWSRLSSISGGGQNAAAGVGNAGIQTGQNMGNSFMNAGNAQAAGSVGTANAVTGAVGNFQNAYLMNQILAGNQAGSVGPKSPMAFPSDY